MRRERGLCVYWLAVGFGAEFNPGFRRMKLTSVCNRKSAERRQRPPEFGRVLFVFFRIIMMRFLWEDSFIKQGHEKKKQYPGNSQCPG